MYVLAQIFGIVAWVFFLLSYYSKRLNKVIFMQMISSILYCINYLLLGAWTGLFVSLFEMLKEIGYYKTDKDKYIFIFTIPIYVLIAFISERSFLVVIPILASLIDGFSILRSKKTAVVGGIISNAMWIVYDLWYLDYIVAFTDAILVISNLSIVLYGYSKFLHRNNTYTVLGVYVTKDTIKRLNELDKAYYDSEYLWTPKKMNELYKLEKNSYILMKDGSKIIGYVNILNIDKKTYDKMMNSDVVYDTFDSEDILPFIKNKECYLNINSIVLKNEYQNSDSINKITNAIEKYIRLKIKKGYNVKCINSFVVNEFEEEIIRKLNFTKEKNITNEVYLYSKSI